MDNDPAGGKDRRILPWRRRSPNQWKMSSHTSATAAASPAELRANPSVPSGNVTLQRNGNGSTTDSSPWEEVVQTDAIRVWLRRTNDWGYIQQAQISVQSVGNEWAWTPERNWFTYHSLNQSSQAVPERQESNDLWQRYQPQPWERKDKPKDGFVPEWDGRKMDRRTYFRKIDLWVATTGVKPEDRGLRLLQNLEGEAFEKLEDVVPETLRVPNSVELFKQKVDNAYEPVEDFRVGKVMDGFYHEFKRKRDEEISDFMRRWDIETKKAERHAGEITERWKAHLFIKKLNINAMMTSQLRTASLGEFTVDAMSKAALRTFPDIKAAFSNQSSGQRQSYNSSRLKNKCVGKNCNPHKRTSPKRKFPKKTHKAHEVEVDPEAAESDRSGTEELRQEVQNESSESEGPEKDEPETDVPDELQEKYLECQVLITRAKMQRRDLENARGYYKKGAVTGKQADVEKAKKLHPCKACGAYGHWYKETVCPKHPDNKKKDKKGYAVCYPTDSDQTKQKLENGLYAYVDTACAKSVMSEKDARELLKQNKWNWPVYKVEDLSLIHISEPTRPY